MYRTYDEEVFLAPESIISGVLASAAYADEPELPDVESVPPVWTAAAAGCDADADADADAQTDAAPDEPERIPEIADPIDAWSQHARGASGFGG